MGRGFDAYSENRKVGCIGAGPPSVIHRHLDGRLVVPLPARSMIIGAMVANRVFPSHSGRPSAYLPDAYITLVSSINANLWANDCPEEAQSGGQMMTNGDQQ